jgi:putative FmdB family regulatory protein
MPLYEYQCDACGRVFELIRKFSDLPLEKCPHCGGAVHKLFSSPAIQFKGSGFYITDYPKKDQTPTAPSGESTSDTASTDRATAEKSGEKSSEKSDKVDKAEKSDKTDKTDKSPAKAEAKPSTGGDSSSAGTSTSTTAAKK